MAEDGPYSSKDLRYALNSAAVLGWIAVTAWSIPPSLLFLIFAIIIGLPIAFGACWLIGAPVLRWILRRPMGYGRAAFSGGLIAALMSLASIATGRFFGWMESVDESRSSQFGYGEFTQSVDGILTPYGWLIVAQNSLTFIAIGAAIGVFVRAKIGPGKMSQA